MSMVDSITKLLRLIRIMGATIKRLDKRLTDLEQGVNQYQAARDAQTVPPGSTLFAPCDVRFFRITADSGTTATAKLQTIDSTGTLVDDSDDNADYTLYKPDTSVTLTVGAKLPASFEGVATSGGTARYYVLSAPATRAGIFPVRVQQTGGANGSNSSVATYTYTVRDLAGTVLGTNMPLARPRMRGEVTFQGGLAGYGEAFYDGSTLRLWDAGEVLVTEACN